MLKTISDKGTQRIAHCIVIGSRRVLGHAMTCPNIPCLEIKTVNASEDGNYALGILNLIDLDNVNVERFRVGEISGMCSRVAYGLYRQKHRVCQCSNGQRGVNYDINKEFLKADSVDFIGHTKIFSVLTKTVDSLTLFEINNLRGLVFSQVLHSKHNNVLNLYHDQEHIATKTLDFGQIIFITAGMPILRTSVDHGTVFDIAGKGDYPRGEHNGGRVSGGQICLGIFAGLRPSLIIKKSI